MWWSFITLQQLVMAMVPMSVAGKLVAGFTANGCVCGSPAHRYCRFGLFKSDGKKRNMSETEVRRALADGHISSAERWEINKLSRD